MKHSIERTLAIALTLAAPLLSRAADVSLIRSDPFQSGAGYSSFLQGGSWSNGQPPSATNDYFTSVYFMRTPADGNNYTFAGNSLTLQTPGDGQGAPMRSIIYKGTGGNIYTINNLTNAGGVINSGSGNVSAPTFTGNLMTVAADSTIQADQGSFIIGYPIAGSATLTNTSGQGRTITYTGDLSAFTGNFNINNNVTVALNAGSSNLGNPAAPTPDQITIGAGCTLLDNAGLTFNNPNSGIRLAGNATVSAAATTILDEPISDNGLGYTLTAGGPGTLVLGSANNSYSGGTTISGGALQLGVTGALPVGNLTDNAALDLNGFSATVDGLSGSGTVDTVAGGTPTLTVGANGGGGTFSGVIQNSSGTLSLTKVGAGTETLTGGYTYSGTTLAAGGTLSVSTVTGTVPSAPGDLVVSNGAVLAVDTTASGVSLPARNIVVGTNSTVSLALNGAAGGINANGNLTVQNNATISLNYGTLTANPTAAEAVNLAGGISVAGTNVVINVTGLGFQPGTFTLIKYTGAPLANLANFRLITTPGVLATLVNNTGSDSIDLNITSVSRQLTWYGANGTSWDLTSVNWKDTSGADTVYRQYTNNSTVVGDGATFDDTLTNDFVNPQPTNINVTGVFSPYPFVVNSTLPYSFSGAGGIAGLTSLVKSNTGPVLLLTSNSFSGGVFVYGGSVVITNDSALGASGAGVTLNTGTLQINGNTASSRAIAMPASSSIGVGAGNTATLGGVISGAGGLSTVDNGTLVLTAPETFAGDLFVKLGTVILDSGGSISNANYNDVGQNGTDNGTLTLKGTGALFTSSDFNVGDLDSSVGTLNVQDAATLTVNALYIGSANAAGSTASGTVNQTGGTVTENATGVGTFAIGGRASALGVGVYDLSGGTLTAHAGVRVGGAGTGTFNQSGGTFNAVQGVNIARLAGSAGAYNLNGGTLATYNVTSSTGSNSVFNFNGGTLLAAFTNATPFMSGLSQANVLAGGAIIDDGGNNVLIPQPLLAGSSGGGLTKLGAGTLTLTGVNTFTGPITNNAGTLVLNSASTYAGGATVNAGTLQMTTLSALGGNTTVGDGAVLSIVQSASGNASLGNLTLNGAGTAPGATLSLAITAANNPAVPLVTCGALTLNGQDTINLAGAIKVGTIALVKAAGPIAGSGTIANLILPQGAVGSISTSFDGTYTTVSAVITSVGPGLVWTGAISDVWDINATTNWLLGSTPTTYQQAIIPGDAVTFNDSGSGVVVLNTNVGPANLTISNNTVNYTFGGTGTISGPTGLQKLGTGTAVLNLTNNTYTGNTTISNGTLQLGSAAAISPNANLVMGANGTLELAGLSPTAGDLTGSGTVDNNSGSNPILTVGGSSGGTWNGTIRDHGAGGVALHKVGSGTWIVGGGNFLNDGQPFTDLSLINGGPVILTNGGLLSVLYTQCQIASGTGQTGTVVVAGGTLAVSNNVLSVGYGSSTANGTLIVNSGSVVHGGSASGGFAAVANSIDVGAQGATGTLIVNGGQVLNTQLLYLGDGGGASGTLYLNGGLLQASAVQANGTPNASIAYFNGGTLQAVTNSADFIPAGTTPYIQSGGLILDDGGFAVSLASQGLQDDPASPGGPLTKTGAGAVYLDAYNTYTGTTYVTNGTLAGIGTITGPVVVAPGGNLGAGDAGSTVGSPLTIANSLTLQGTATFRISVNGGLAQSDSIVGVTTANYGGTLAITNATSDGTALASGDTFQLFSATAHTGNFGGIAGSPGAGLAYSFDPASGVLSVVTSTIANNPTNITFSVSGTTLNLSWPADHLGWILQSQTNSLSTGLSNNWFDVAGSTSVTNMNFTVNPTNPAVFYRLRHP